MPLLLLLFLLLLPPLVQGQPKPAAGKHWHEGPLSWSDFSERKVESKTPSELRFYLAYAPRKEKFQDTVLHRLAATCYLDRQASWVHPDHKTENLLRYNQVIFDIAELYRRELHLALSQAKTADLTQYQLQRISQKCFATVETMRRETGQGQDLAALAAWELLLREKLSGYAGDELPRFRKSRFGYGLYGGFGGGTLSHSLGRHFSQRGHGGYGFEFAYGPSVLFLNAVMAGGRVSREYPGGGEAWAAGQRSNLALGDLSYGYRVVDQAKVRLVPYVGLGLNEISEPTKVPQVTPSRLVAYNFVAGLAADYKLRKALRLYPHPLSQLRETAETNIRTKLHVSRAAFAPDLKGYAITLSAGFSLTGNFLRLVED
jgi:hypothetical protein